MRCAKCSASQKLEDIYCPNCGALIEVPEDETLQVTTGLVSGKVDYISFSRLFADSISKFASQFGFKPGSIWRKPLSWILLMIMAILIIAAISPVIL